MHVADSQVKKQEAMFPVVGANNRSLSSERIKRDRFLCFSTMTREVATGEAIGAGIL
jgi:hypothetical protein